MLQLTSPMLLRYTSSMTTSSSLMVFMGTFLPSLCLFCNLSDERFFSWFRHPSYAGFFYWALGTQLLLQNPFCFIFFLASLWRFFFYRIRGQHLLSKMITSANSNIVGEENALIKFFGEEYSRYRERVGTKIPFIP